MNQQRTIREYTDHARRVEEFDAHDKRGRRIGVQVNTFVATYTIAPADASCCYTTTRPAGTYYVAEVQTTRDGVAYGACQPHAHFATVEERDAYIAKRIADSRKRAAKAGA